MLKHCPQLALATHLASACICKLDVSISIDFIDSPNIISGPALHAQRDPKVADNRRLNSTLLLANGACHGVDNLFVLAGRWCQVHARTRMEWRGERDTSVALHDTTDDAT